MQIYVSERLGGSPYWVLNSVQAGHYYVGQHGQQIEVSQRAYRWSRYLGLVAQWSFILLLLCILILILSGQFRDWL